MAQKPAPNSPAAALQAQNAPNPAAIPPVTAAPLPEAAQTVKVRFKRGHPSLAYSIGEEADLPQALYDQHVGEGEFFEKI